MWLSEAQCRVEYCYYPIDGCGVEDGCANTRWYHPPCLCVLDRREETGYYVWGPVYTENSKLTFCDEKWTERII